MWRALEKVRNLLLRILNKQFLIFLFFLILSSVFWLIMTRFGWLAYRARS